MDLSGNVRYKLKTSIYDFLQQDSRRQTGCKHLGDTFSTDEGHVAQLLPQPLIRKLLDHSLPLVLQEVLLMILVLLICLSSPPSGEIKWLGEKDQKTWICHLRLADRLDTYQIKMQHDFMNNTDNQKEKINFSFTNERQVMFINASLMQP